MRKFYKLFLLLLSAGALIACSKDKGEELLFDKIPDPEFKRYLVTTYDQDMDMTLSTKEMGRVTSIWIFGNTYNIKSFQGIEHFMRLDIFRIHEIEIETIDLSKNFSLDEIYIFDSPKLQTIYLPVSLNGKIATYIEGSSTNIEYK